MEGRGGDAVPHSHRDLEPRAVREDPSGGVLVRAAARVHPDAEAARLRDGVGRDDRAAGADGGGSGAGYCVLRGRKSQHGCNKGTLQNVQMPELLRRNHDVVGCMDNVCINSRTND